jgi:glycosyltransferase involved in cell wall biosynthesis
MTRVAAVINAFRPVLGGAQRQLEAIAPHLEARGVHLDVVTRRPGGAPAREDIPGSGTIHRVSPSGGSKARDSLLFALGGTRQVVRLRPDVVHAFDLLSPSTVGVSAAGLLRVPMVVKILSVGVGGDVDRLLRKPGGERRLALLARRVAAFVCLSEEVEAELVDHGVPRERLVRIPNAVDAERFRPPAGDERARLRAELGWREGEHVALYCGRFYEAKRLDRLIAAMADAPGRLVLFGEGPAEARLRELAAPLGDRVELRSPVPDTAPLYRAADAYVSASGSEGMSGSVLEALSSGLPAVAAPASGMAELLAGGAGLLLPDAEPGSFAAALSRLADETDLAPRLGAAARERALARYTPARVADALAELYADVRASAR